MISWIEGETLDIWVQGTRVGIVLVSNRVGFEIQVLPRQMNNINLKSKISLWIQPIKRDDNDILIGFKYKEERDLFRQLISVTGIGSQVGVALLQEYQVDELTKAIIDSDFKKLSKAVGVGKRTAERLSVELKKKLYLDSVKAKQYKEEEQEIPDIKQNTDTELTKTLRDLGYQDLEIKRAIKAVSDKKIGKKLLGTGFSLENDHESQECLKDILVWLSNEGS